MNLYKATIGDNDGSSNIDTYNILAEDIDVALRKAKQKNIITLSKIRSEEIRDHLPKKERLEKDYDYTVDSVEFVCSIDVQ